MRMMSDDERYGRTDPAMVNVSWIKRCIRVEKNYPLGKRFIIYSLTRRTRVEFVVRLGRKKKENTSEKGRSSSRVSI